MKKKSLLIIIIIACFVFTACGEKEETKSVVGGWEIVMTDNQIGFDEEELAMFNSAKDNYTGMILEPVALLGQQIVAGTNYMFLAKGYQAGEEDEADYKIVVIYQDLEGKGAITHVSDFDFTKYTHENVQFDGTTLVGGWSVSSPGKLNVLDDDKVATAWENATSTLTGMLYNPIAVVGKQLVSGTNYAILCYGRASYEGMPEAIYMITLYVDLNGSQEIVSQSYVDITEYN